MSYVGKQAISEKHNFTEHLEGPDTEEETLSLDSLSAAEGSPLLQVLGGNAACRVQPGLTACSEYSVILHR